MRYAKPSDVTEMFLETDCSRLASGLSALRGGEGGGCSMWVSYFKMFCSILIRSTVFVLFYVFKYRIYKVLGVFVLFYIFKYRIYKVLGMFVLFYIFKYSI